MTVRKSSLKKFIKSTLVLSEGGESEEWKQGIETTLRALDQWFDLGYFG